MTVESSQSLLPSEGDDEEMVDWYEKARQHLIDAYADEDAAYDQI